MSEPLDRFKDALAVHVYGMTKSEALERKICINCKEEAEPRIHTAAGRREYLISGFCEVCFNEITAIFGE